MKRRSASSSQKVELTAQVRLKHVLLAQPQPAPLEQGSELERPAAATDSLLRVLRPFYALKLRILRPQRRIMQPSRRQHDAVGQWQVECHRNLGRANRKAELPARFAEPTSLEGSRRNESGFEIGAT